MPRGNQTLAARGWKTLDWGEKGGGIEGAPENIGNLEKILCREMLDFFSKIILIPTAEHMLHD